jgi:uncharacterized membrane protein YidH (DUF202 family)
MNVINDINEKVMPVIMGSFMTTMGIYFLSVVVPKLEYLSEMSDDLAQRVGNALLLGGFFVGGGLCYIACGLNNYKKAKDIIRRGQEITIQNNEMGKTIDDHILPDFKEGTPEDSGYRVD